MIMAGNIFADSEPAHGARLTIHVPAILSAGADRNACAQNVEAPIGAA